MDDLFKENINGTYINVVFETFNYRYLNYLPVIISTEFTTLQLLTFNDAEEVRRAGL